MLPGPHPRALFVPAGSVAVEAREGSPFVSHAEGLRKGRETGKRVFLCLGRYDCAWWGRNNEETFTDPGLYTLFLENYEWVSE